MADQVKVKKQEIFEQLVVLETECKVFFGLKSIQVRITGDPYDTAIHIHIYPDGTNDKIVLSVSVIAELIGYYFVDEWSSTILDRHYVPKKSDRFNQYADLVKRLTTYFLAKLPSYELLDVDLYNMMVYDEDHHVQVSQIDKQVIYHFFFTDNTW